jgi:hypothetical protein
VGDWSEHRQEALLDTDGKRHPALGMPSFWNHVIGNVIADAYGSLIMWDCLCKQLTHLDSLQNKHSAVISTQRKLPAEYLKALLTFRHTLDRASKVPILSLKIGVPASPPLRSRFVREPHIRGSTKIRVISKKGVRTDYLMWIFQTLWDDQQLFLVRLPDLMDELERLIHNNPREKEKLSPWVAHVYSDLGVIAGALHEINIYQPWAAGFDNESVNYKEEIEKEFTKQFSGLAELSKIFKESELSLDKLGTPSDGKFNYPSDKRRTQQHTKAMRAAERDLDMFWQTVDQHYQRESGKSLHQAFQSLFSCERQLERTPEWIQPVKEPEVESEPDLSEDLSQRFSYLRVESQEQPVEQAIVKTKEKTRGTLQSTDSIAAQLTPCDHEPPVRHILDIQPTIAVSRRAIKVFSTLFHTPSSPDQAGEIPWADFLHAMVAAGFGPAKLYGSVWQFTPFKLDVERSIQFHEPHPRGKIPFRTARRFGRRLNRAYGWRGDMFVLAE